MLFDKIKEPITVFQSIKEFDLPLKFKVNIEYLVKCSNKYLQNMVFLQVVEMYKSIVDQMQCYEKLKLTNWISKSKLLVQRQMDSNILICVRNINNNGKYNLYYTK